MTAMRILIGLCVALALALTVTTGGCVKVETGYSHDEARESSEETANRIRGEWAEKIRVATPPEKARLLTDLYLQVVEAHFRFGREIALKWDETQQQRGVDIPARDIQSMIDRWMNSQGPIIAAYRDNLVFAREQITLNEYFRQNFLDALGELLDTQQMVYRVVFEPQGSLDDYEYNLQQAEFKSGAVLDTVRELLKSQ